MYTHQHRDSGVLTEAPKISSAKPTGEAPSSLPQGIRRSLREVARKLRDMNPQWKQYLMFCGASLAFLGIFGAQEISSRRRLNIVGRLHDGDMPEVANAKAQNNREYNRLNPRALGMLQGENIVSDDAGNWPKFEWMFSKQNRPMRSERDEERPMSSGRARAETMQSDGAGSSLRLVKSDLTPQAPTTQHKHVKERQGFATIAVTSFLSVPVLYVIFGGDVLWAQVLLPCLLLLPFLILGTLNKKYWTTAVLTGAVACVTIPMVLDAQNIEVASSINPLLQFGSFLFITGFAFMLMWQSGNWFVAGKGLCSMKTLGVTGLAAVSLGTAVVSGNAFLPSAIGQPDCWNNATGHMVNSVGLVTLLVGLAFFGWAVLFRLNRVSYEMGIVTLAATGLLGVIGWQGLELINPTKLTDFGFNADLLLSCLMGLGALVLLLLIWHTKAFGDEFKCKKLFKIGF